MKSEIVVGMWKGEINGNVILTPININNNDKPGRK